jgi:hypothetical protein
VAQGWALLQPQLATGSPMRHLARRTPPAITRLGLLALSLGLLAAGAAAGPGPSGSAPHLTRAGGPAAAAGAEGVSSWADLSAAVALAVAQQQSTAGGDAPAPATVQLAAGELQVPAGQSLSVVAAAASLRLVGAGPGRTVLRCAPGPPAAGDGGPGGTQPAGGGAAPAGEGTGSAATPADPAVFNVSSAGAFALESLSILGCARPILVRACALGAAWAGRGRLHLAGPYPAPRSAQHARVCVCPGGSPVRVCGCGACVRVCGWVDGWMWVRVCVCG